MLALSGMWGDVAGWVVGTRAGRRPHHVRRPVGPLRETGSDFLPWRLRKPPDAGESGAERPASCPRGLCPTSIAFSWRAGNYFPRRS
jgi:hypothetical protein